MSDKENSEASTSMTNAAISAAQARGWTQRSKVKVLYHNDGDYVLKSAYDRLRRELIKIKKTLNKLANT